MFEPFLPAKKNVDLRGRQLQVIVKAANIHLTPEKPEYSGGAWLGGVSQPERLDLVLAEVREAQ
ncbi:MAG: uncharacterized protein KVP18_004692 [Porospora cf. gigantea A]|uniref:uncharacterized protein n=1 Tax=Porospora cf. gigantea A TaxID=2853593 RepID=UPI00355A2B39|nr:MAG: hypothetical protein KVP18_004692 [Porospora cf. gigantea A]